MRRGIWMALGATAGIGGALLVSRRASAASAASPAAPGATPETPPTIELAGLPRAADVSGDLVRNWGETPVDLRPLLMLAEETARIRGAARVLAVIAYRESRFVTTAQNGNAAGEQDERDSSRDAYNNRKASNPSLVIRTCFDGRRPEPREPGFACGRVARGPSRTAYDIPYAAHPPPRGCATSGISPRLCGIQLRPVHHFLLRRPPRTPAVYEPTMLKSPTSASDQPAIADGTPTSFR